MGSDAAYQVIVVGAGHAGCEAALAAARMGCRTLLLTLHLDMCGQMSCNPAIGGLAKGHLVREIDALGGEMARNIDATGIQFRVLNTKKGPAVRSSRAQADRDLYRLRMKQVIEGQPGLDLKQGQVVRLLDSGRAGDRRRDPRRPAFSGPGRGADHRDLHARAYPCRLDALPRGAGRRAAVGGAVRASAGSRFCGRAPEDRDPGAAGQEFHRLLPPRGAAR